MLCSTCYESPSSEAISSLTTRSVFPTRSTFGPFAELSLHSFSLITPALAASARRRGLRGSAAVMTLRDPNSFFSVSLLDLFLLEIPHLQLISCRLTHSARIFSGPRGIWCFLLPLLSLESRESADWSEAEPASDGKKLTLGAERRGRRLMYRPRE